MCTASRSAKQNLRNVRGGAVTDTQLASFLERSCGAGWFGSPRELLTLARRDPELRNGKTPEDTAALLLAIDRVRPLLLIRGMRVFMVPLMGKICVRTAQQDRGDGRFDYVRRQRRQC
jgi:hypothetical protein